MPSYGGKLLHHAYLLLTAAILRLSLIGKLSYFWIEKLKCKDQLNDQNWMIKMIQKSDIYEQNIIAVQHNRLPSPS